MLSNKCLASEKGYGCFIDDSGFLIEKCIFHQNREGGLYIDCHDKPQNQIPNEVKCFLDRYPMIIQMCDCEFIQNQRNGCIINNFWKGPVLIEKCKFYENMESGLIL